MVTAREIAIATLLAGCVFDSPTPTGDDSALGCFGTGAGFTFCIPDDVAVTEPFAVTENTLLDSSASGACTFAVDQPQRICVKAATEITIDGNLRLIGRDPVVLLATTSLTMTANGSIDVASHRGELVLGAGANAPECAPSSSGLPDAAGGGGGGGGSFSNTGGIGGEGNTRPNSGGFAGLPVTTPLALRGGCKAGDGGAGGKPGGVGGNGGGAVYLLSGGAIELAGRVNSSGAGGSRGADDRAGGGGGGSGGMIAVFATTELTTTASVFANGGGGGEGGDSGNDGNDGFDPSQFDTTAAGGSDGNGGNGGQGGDGAFLTTLALAGVSAGDGGGGGGGGAGFILVVSGQALGPNVSP